MKNKYTLIIIASLIVFIQHVNAQKIAAGLNHSLMLCADSTVWATGDNMYGQLGDTTYYFKSVPK